MLTEDQESEILSAALMLFDLEGIDTVKPSDIAGLANISVAQLTTRFPTMEDVVRAIVTQSIIQPMARSSAELPSGSAGDRLRNYCGRAWEIINTPRFAMIYRLLINEVPLHPALASFFADEVAGPIRRQVENILAQGIARGEFRSLPTASAARAIAGSLVTQAFWCNHADLWGSAFCGTPSRVVPETIALMLNGLNSDSSAILNPIGDPR
jgi:AcrR family transcriptional regulator